VKIIFSRKGFDTSSGGVPSPIIDKVPISLPIPTNTDPSNTRYCDINLGGIVEDLSNGKIRSTDKCHKDPDLELGAFGQDGAAQTHLKNQGVGAGDLFLFFGLFQKAHEQAGVFKYQTGSKPEHRIFGWLQVGTIVNLRSDGKSFSKTHPKYEAHPHLLVDWMEKEKDSSLYLPPDQLNILREHGLPGFGKFSAENSNTLLSSNSSSCSLWKVPDWLNIARKGCGLSYHKNKALWRNDTLQTVGRGQEFVSDPKEDERLIHWLVELFKNAI